MRIHTSNAELKVTGVTIRISLAPEEAKSIQERVREVAADLAGVEERLRVVLRSLPEVPDAVASHAAPYGVEAEIRTTLEVVLTDDVGPALRRLRRAAEVTPERLREEWERRRAEG